MPTVRQPHSFFLPSTRPSNCFSSSLESIGSPYWLYVDMANCVSYICVSVAKIRNRNYLNGRFNLSQFQKVYSMGVWPHELGLDIMVVGEHVLSLHGGTGREGDCNEIVTSYSQQPSSFTKILPPEVPRTSQNIPSAETWHLIHKAVGNILNSNHNILPLTPIANGHLLYPFSPYQRVHRILIVPTFF